MAESSGLFERRNKTGREEPDGRKWVTPVRWISKRGHIITVDGTVWLFRSVPSVPQLWRDNAQQLTDAVPLAETLADIGLTSKSSHLPGGAINRYRRIALLVHSWMDEINVSHDATPELAAFQRSLYEGPDGRLLMAKRRSVLIGVMLRPASIRNVLRQVYEYFSAGARRALGASEQILELYKDDTAEMEAIFARHGMSVPTREQFAWIDAWFNGGRNPDIEIVEYPDRLLVGPDAIEILALQHFDTETMSSSQRWIGQILDDPQGPTCLASFATLEPADEARTRARKAARRTRRQAETGAEIGDEERAEHQTQYAAAKELEEYFLGRSEPWLTQASVLVGRRRPQTSTSFIDEARTAHGINFLALTGSQHLALTETVLGPRHANPYLQDLSISHLSNTGIIGFETLGDPSGVDLGLSTEGDPVRLDPALSGKTSRAPIMPIFAATGSGKTFALQSLACQLALQGWFVPFVNPKPGSDLSPMVDMVPGARCDNLTEFIGSGRKTGALDPFSFAEPQRAATILSDFILTFFHGLFGGGLADDPVHYALRDKVRTGLQLAAAGGARCAWEAIKAIDWPGGENDERFRILEQSLQTNPLFALAVGTEPQSGRGLGDTLSLIQYGDYDVPMPPLSATPDQYEDQQWFGVAVTQHIMTYCTELIRTRLSGALIFDEATILTASQIGRDTIDRFGRLFRESGGLLVVATQRPSDLLNNTIDITESHSRTLTGHLKSEREMLAASEFMGLSIDSPAENEERARFYANCGPVEPQPGKAGRSPWFVHEDLEKRVSQVQVAVPEHIRLQFTTRPDEKLARRQAAEAEEVARVALEAAARNEDIDPDALTVQGD